MRRRLLLVVLAGLVLAACSGGSGGDDEPTAVSTTTAVAPTAAPTSTAPESSADPFAIPDVIDAVYVNRILAELYRIDGESTRKILASNTVTFEDLEPLRAIYNDPQFELEAQGLLQVLERREDFLSPPGNRKVVVLRLVNRSPDCIVAEVETSFADVVRNPPAKSPDKANFIALTPTQSGADEKGLNPTSWSIIDAEILDRGRSPSEPCA